MKQIETLNEFELVKVVGGKSKKHHNSGVNWGQVKCGFTTATGTLIGGLGGGVVGAVGGFAGGYSLGCM